MGTKTRHLRLLPPRPEPATSWRPDTLYIAVGDEQHVIEIPRGRNGDPVRVSVAYVGADHAAAVDFGNGASVLRAVLRERCAMGWRGVEATLLVPDADDLGLLDELDARQLEARNDDDPRDPDDAALALLPRAA